ncbi:tyrosine-protein phosphatase [Levilactobacillus tujiorum]|uniref:tyrosine-protein phosphatase n=1 Tax=Levilactobacillus tujiorum TaxID=2912243 RepID=UPI0014567BDF|nr:tyrosine-protein phosphatase [Levilactobacillus tujiorum]NLR31016.1 tyrosine-protein phosphatase [Levilactobacillus tujiorum]
MRHLIVKSLGMLGVALTLAGIGTAPAAAATTTAANPNAPVLTKSARSFPLLTDGSDPADLRLVQLYNTKNTRDIGGYRTADGKWKIRPYQLLRSDNLSRLDADDVKTLTDKYRVKSVVDFRTPGQVKSQPDVKIPGATETYLSVLGPHAYADGGGDGDFYNQRLNFGYSAITGYRQFLNMLAVNNGGATLYHCSSGKDRTGIATVLIMTILGMDKQTIVNDFMLSQYTGRTVKIDWISKYYYDVELNYGSLQNYINTALAISPATQARLRAKYLVSTDGKNTPYPAPTTPTQPNPTPTVPTEPEVKPVPKPQPEPTPVESGAADQVTHPKKKAAKVKVLKTKRLKTKYHYQLKAHKKWFKDAHLKHQKGKTPKSTKKWRLLKSEKVRIKHKTYTYYQIQDHSGHTAWILKSYVTKK